MINKIATSFINSLAAALGLHAGHAIAKKIKERKKKNSQKETEEQKNEEK